MAILGLTTSEETDDFWSLNARRKVFYQYPNGAAPLMGLLSMMDNSEDGETDKPEFGWWEQRAVKFEYKTASANAAGPFTDTSGASGAAGTDKTTAGWGESADTTIRVQLAAGTVDTIQVRDIMMFRNIPGTSSSEKTFQAIVTAVWEDQDTIDVQLLETVANVLNTTAANNMDVLMIGSATAEADRSKRGFWTTPIDVYNYTQIFRHAFDFSRNAMKEGLKFDDSGPYKTKAKDNSIKHMIAMEKAAFFSNRGKQTGVTTDDSLTSVRRQMGGILWYLKQWELGNTANNGAFDYRVGGSDLTSTAWDGDDDKRVLDINGTVSKSEFEDILERAFRFTNNPSFEKIFLCGSGILKSFNQFVDREAVRTTKLDVKERYGMEVVTWESPFGIIHFKTHPLFNQTAVYRNSGFILDIGDIKYTPFQDSDTNLLKNRQPRDFDGRKDEWLTEFGLEVRYPENHMFIDRLTGITS